MTQDAKNQANTAATVSADLEKSNMVDALPNDMPETVPDLSIDESVNLAAELAHELEDLLLNDDTDTVRQSLSQAVDSLERVEKENVSTVQLVALFG